jgi:hypothetical protein
MPDVVDYPYALSLHTALFFFGGNTNNSLQMTIEKVLGSFTMLCGTVVTAVIVSQVSVLMSTVQASERQYVNKVSWRCDPDSGLCPPVLRTDRRVCPCLSSRTSMS